ncbi:MAG: butyrate kinase [Tissierellia bacterium]|nr:butyrate kinase [Tissierellia bacterium]
MRILVINPGGTSTKIAVYEDEKLLMSGQVEHTQKDLETYETVLDQLDMRMNAMFDALENEQIPLESIDGVSGRGGLLKPIPGGTYAVNEAMLEDVANAINGEHPSNLGSAMAKAVGDKLGIPSFVVDPVSVDEFVPEARITGLEEISKHSWLHALNQKAVGRKIAGEMGKQYEDVNLIIAHLGSGISVAAHEKGKMIDGSGARSDGPFSPERTGGLLTYDLVNLCFSGKYTHEELVKKISTASGFYDYLGTKDTREVEARIDAGDEKAQLIWNSFVYQVAKEICLYSGVLFGNVDGVGITGGMSHSKRLVEAIRERVEFLAPVFVVPGELEMEALAAGALRVLSGVEDVKEYK